MHKKVILGLAAAVLTIGFAGSSLNARATEVDGSVWVESPTSIDDAKNPVVETSDDAVSEETAIKEEAEEEPTMWPVYLSFGAICVTLLLVIIVNLSGRRYNKK